jgi:PAS domain S-box-containing protein
VRANQRYAILTLLQAVLGGIIAVATFATYQVDPGALQNGSLTILIAGFGALAALYYLSVHQLIKQKQAKLSAILISCITAANILLVIVATGGLDSPYYTLWLLSIVIAGTFGLIATALTSGVTVLFYAYELMRHGFSSSYELAHVGQLIITLCTAVAAEWLHEALGRSAVQHQKVSQLSGQLSEEALKSNVLMQSVGEGVLVVDAKRQIQLFNPAAVRLTGWDQDSARSIDYRLVLNLHNADGSKLSDDVDPFAAMWEGGKSLVRNDLTMQTKGGHTTAISLSLSPIYDAKHQISGGIALFRDISAEKEIERQRDEFISTASHEMRTPVAAIEGYLALAMNATVATIDDRAKGYLEKAHTSTQHLGSLFQDLLSITKLEEEAKSDSQEYLDLTQLVKETSADMQFSAQKKNLEIQFGTSGQQVRKENTVLPVYVVKANPQRLREVVMNLLEHVTISGTGDAVTVAVTDEGIGISAEDISHLFQKFYRVDSSATRTIGGTGLGLYLCRTIVELAGGRIWVESKLGQGSSFKFSLPIQSSDKLTAQPAYGPAAPAKTPPAAKKVVLAAR